VTLETAKSAVNDSMPMPKETRPAWQRIRGGRKLHWYEIAAITVAAATLAALLVALFVMYEVPEECREEECREEEERDEYGQ
jgi:hypothetical protein